MARHLPDVGATATGFLDVFGLSAACSALGEDEKLMEDEKKIAICTQWARILTVGLMRMSTKNNDTKKH